MDSRAREISILIADGQTLFREGLRELLEEQPDFHVVGEAPDGVDALRLTVDLKPDVLLLDLEIPKLNGKEVLERLAAAAAKTRTVLLAASIENDPIPEVFRLGARGFILKESPTSMLLKCIRSVAAGQFWMVHGPVSDVNSPDPQKTPRIDPRLQPRRFGLTDREREVLVLVIAGKTNRQIAEQFSISEQTVKHHITHIFDKVGVYNRLELALFAIHHGLVRRA
jgi:DNA-binding NarL/FixJ family response regulator